MLLKQWYSSLHPPDSVLVSSVDEPVGYRCQMIVYKQATSHNSLQCMLSLTHYIHICLLTSNAEMRAMIPGIQPIKMMVKIER